MKIFRDIICLSPAPNPSKLCGTMIANRTATVLAPSGPRLPGGDLSKRQRARRTNDPFAGLDMNMARGRRAADLVRAYLAALGNPTDIERQAAVIAAAELQVLAEEARSVALKRPGGHFWATDPFEGEIGAYGATAAPTILRFLEGAL